MSERLTDLIVGEENEYCSYIANEIQIINKLGKLEDLMEKYGFESVEDLEDTIKKVDGLILKATQGERLNKELEKANKQIRFVEEQLENAIVPKFKIGQEVFLVIDKVEPAKIEKVICTIAKLDDENSTWYSLTDSYGYALRLPEEQVFTTREEAEKRLAELEGK